MKRRRFLIGLTGNIATGKSLVAQMLAELGARVVDADQVAHAVMLPGGAAHDAVVEAFGSDILSDMDADGTIDRAKLGAIVFRDPAALRRLEQAVHPATVVAVNHLIAAATERVVVVEAIKLIEAGMHRRYDALWVVTAPREVQIARLVAIRGLSQAEAALRVDAQPPQAEKAALADLVIVNDGGMADLRLKVEAGWAEVKRRVWGERERAARRPVDKLEQLRGGQGDPPGAGIEVRRARRGDVPEIVTLVRQATQGKRSVEEAEVLDWLFGKGLLVAAQDTNGSRVVGVAAWQAENLLSVTDQLHTYPAKLRAEAGGRLLAAIEAEANVLMCEANVVILPPQPSKAVRTFFNKQGYELKTYQELHRIWREVLGEYVADQPELMVKRLREQMIMVPI